MKITVPTIDFGTSKIVTMVAQSNGERCDIVGSGAVPYSGYLQDGWNNPDEIRDVIRTAIDQAQKTGNCRIHELNVGVPGMFTRVIVKEVHVSLTGPDPHVTAQDVRACFKLAEESGGDRIIHSAPAWFRVDDGKKTLSPVGIKGRELSAMIALVTADKYFIDDITYRLRDMDIEPREFYSTVAGEATYALSQDERDKTAMLIDIGYLCTDVMAVEGDAVIFHKVIPMGGGDIAADLAYGLEIPLSSAEQIKRAYVFGVSAGDEKYDALDRDGVSKSFTREEVANVLEPRVEEIAEAIHDAVKGSGVRLGNWSVAYLTGGGLAINRGGRDFLSAKLDRPVRELPRKTGKLSSPVYTSVLGLLDLIIDTLVNANANRGVRAFFNNLFGG